MPPQPDGRSVGGGGLAVRDSGWKRWRPVEGDGVAFQDGGKAGADGPALRALADMLGRGGVVRGDRAVCAEKLFQVVVGGTPAHGGPRGHPVYILVRTHGEHRHPGAAL